MTSESSHKEDRKRWCFTSKSVLLLKLYILSEVVSFIILVLIVRSASSGDGILSSYQKERAPTEKEKYNVSNITSDTTIVALPPLNELIATNGTIIGDISWMLDFAIIAFPKSGTTFMKDYLNQTSETYVYDREYCMKRHEDVGDFVREYYDLHVRYNQPQYPKTIQFGLKCPGVFYRADDIHLYNKFFPSTKFIVGLRHPVKWFESFYNYQVYRNVSLPTNTSKLIGRCIDHKKVCTDRGRLHAALARLGKTPMLENEELSLLYGQDIIQATRHSNTDMMTSSTQDHRRLSVQPDGLANEIFLYEVRQIHDKESSKELSKSIQRYLGIHEEFPEIQQYKQNKTRAINICNGEHDKARKVLVEHASSASNWIQQYFLGSSDVTVADPNSFHHLLNDWSVDPC